MAAKKGTPCPPTRLFVLAARIRQPTAVIAAAHPGSKAA